MILEYIEGHLVDLTENKIIRANIMSDIRKAIIKDLNKNAKVVI